jgi:glucosylceramidase
MNEDDQIRLVNLLGPKLATEGLKTKIFVHDHNWGLHPNDRKVIGGDVKMDPVESVTKMFSDSTAGRYIAGSAWHCYYGDDALMTSTYNTIHRRFPDKEILCTESGAWSKNRGNWWGDIDWGMRTVWLGGPQNACQACINWNLALNCDYGPTPRTDSAALGLVNIETGDYQGVRFEREYYAMAQMSRAARPGAKRIAAMFETSATNDLDVIAFGLPGNKTSTVVFNRSQTQQAFQIEADKFFFAFQIPGHSIVTFVW